MSHPCNKCIIKGNCSEVCRDYNRFADNASAILVFSTVLLTVTIIVSLLLLKINPSIIWFACIILCFVIPPISINSNFFSIVFLAPFLLIIFIIAITVKKYVLRPVDCAALKNLTFIEKYINMKDEI